MAPVIRPALSGIGAEDLHEDPQRQDRRDHCFGESGMSWVEVVENPAGIVGLPWFAGLLGGVELVQVHQQIDQLAADGRGLEQSRKLGQIDEPPRIPARPVVVSSVDDAETR